MGLNGTHGKAVHIGLNHYFNSNVRLMVDATRGVYLGGQTFIAMVIERIEDTL